MAVLQISLSGGLTRLLAIRNPLTSTPLNTINHWGMLDLPMVGSTHFNPAFWFLRGEQPLRHPLTKADIHNGRVKSLLLT